MNATASDLLEIASLKLTRLSPRWGKIEFDSVAFGQAIQSGEMESPNVHEYVDAAVIRRDASVPCSGGAGTSWASEARPQRQRRSFGQGQFHSDLLKGANAHRSASAASPKHEAFVQAYVTNAFNATEAYKAVSPKHGSENAARAHAARLVANGNIAARIAEIMAVGAARAEVTAEEVIHELKKLGFSCIGKAVTWRNDIVAQELEEGQEGEPKRVLLPRVTIVATEDLTRRRSTRSQKAGPVTASSATKSWIPSLL